jgi:hypothetical protein
MIRILSFFFLFSIPFISTAQTEEPKTSETYSVKGTAILPYTQNYISVMSSGYFSYNVEKADCSSQGEDVYGETDKIDQVIFKDSTIEIHLRIFDNCCYEFLWNPSLSDDGILDLVYIGYGDHCACNCCFGHVIRFKKLDYDLEDKIKIREIRINGKSSYKVNRATK